MAAGSIKLFTAARIDYALGSSGTGAYRSGWSIVVPPFTYPVGGDGTVGQVWFEIPAVLPGGDVEVLRIQVLSGTPTATITAGFSFAWDSIPSWVAHYWFESVPGPIDPTLILRDGTSTDFPTDASMDLDPTSAPNWLQPMFSPGPWQNEPVSNDGLLLEGVDAGALLYSWDDGGGDGTGFTPWSPVDWNTNPVPGFPGAQLSDATTGMAGNSRHIYVLQPPSYDLTADFEIWQFDKQFNVVNILPIHTGNGGITTINGQSNMLVADPADAFVVVWSPLDGAGPPFGHLYKIDTTSGAVLQTYDMVNYPGFAGPVPGSVFCMFLSINEEGTKVYYWSVYAGSTPFANQDVIFERDIVADVETPLIQLPGSAILTTDDPSLFVGYSPPLPLFDNFFENWTFGEYGNDISGVWPLPGDNGFVGMGGLTGAYLVRFDRTGRVRWASPILEFPTTTPMGLTLNVLRSQLWSAMGFPDGTTVRHDPYDGFSPFTAAVDPIQNWNQICWGPSNRTVFWMIGRLGIGAPSGPWA